MWVDELVCFLYLEEVNDQGHPAHSKNLEGGDEGCSLNVFTVGMSCSGMH